MLLQLISHRQNDTTVFMMNVTDIMNIDADVFAYLDFLLV